MLTRRRFVAVSAAGLASSGLATRPKAEALPPVRIGLLMSYTGQLTDPAAQMDGGIKLYLEQHGDHVAGRKIELIRRDTAGAPEAAKRLAQELIVNDQVDILAGFVSSPEALAVTNLSAEAKKFMVVMNAAASIITTKSPYVTRTSFTLWQIGEPLGRWAYAYGLRRAYTMVSDYAPGRDGEAAFQRAFKKAGGEIIGSVRMPLTNVDFSSYVQLAKDANPDGLFVYIPGGSQPIALAKALIERGMNSNKLTITGNGDLTEESALNVMGDAAIGIVTAYHYEYTHKSALNTAFVKAYATEFKRNPDILSVGGYDGMHVIYTALNKTNGNADAEGMVAAVKGLSWESPRGRIAIDPETRDIINTIYIRRVEKVAGHLENVEIESYENVKDPAKLAVN